MISQREREDTGWIAFNIIVYVFMYYLMLFSGPCITAMSSGSYFLPSILFGCTIFMNVVIEGTIFSFLISMECKSWFEGMLTFLYCYDVAVSAVLSRGMTSGAAS